MEVPQPQHPPTMARTHVHVETFSAQLAHALSFANHIPVSSTASALQAIESAMLHLSHLRSSLISSSHACTPFQTLPPELLVKIVVLSTEPHAHARLVQLALVCRAWAGVMFGTSSLWARPTFHSVTAASAILARSKDVPLDVNIDLRDNSSDQLQAAALAVKEISRAQHFHLTALPSALGAVFAFLPSTRTAPALETLSLSNHSVYTAYLALSHMSAPHLRRLTLSDFNVSSTFMSPLLTSTSHLVDLNISQSFVSLDGRPDMSAVLSVLARSAGLTSITLRNCLPAVTGQDGVSHRVTLPHLARLELEDGQALVADLLSCLTLPFTASLRLTALADSTDDEEFTSLSTALAGHLVHSIATRPVEYLQASVEGKSVHLLLGAASERQPSVDTTLVWRGLDETRPARVIAGVLGAIPMEGITRLTIADAPMTADIWRFILRRTPSVVVLQAESDALAGMFEALAASHSSPLLVPRLRALTLARALFSDAGILHAFVAFVKHWRTHKTAALIAAGTVGAPEPSWTTADPALAWHRDLQSIDLDRCGFVSDDSIAQLKEAGFTLA